MLRDQSVRHQKTGDHTKLIVVLTVGLHTHAPRCTLNIINVRRKKTDQN